MESLALVPVPEIPGAGAGAGAGGGKEEDEDDENEEVLMNFEGCFLHPDLIEGILTAVRASVTTSLPLFAQYTPTPLPPCLPPHSLFLASCARPQHDKEDTNVLLAFTIPDLAMGRYVALSEYYLGLIWTLI